MTKRIILFLFLVFVSGNSLAKKNIWRDCGIGALIFSETKWAAVTSNITWDLGITGSSSTSSSPDQCAGTSYNSAEFIYKNIASLEEEIIVGEGRYLSALLDISSCEVVERENIVKNFRNQYTKSLEKGIEKRQRKVEAFYDIFETTVKGEFSHSCMWI